MSKKPLNPSPFLIRVLAAIDEASRNDRFTSPGFIANAVFPRDHPGWSRSCKCGPYGSTRGSGLVMMMGGYLGKLKRAEQPLVESHWTGHNRQHTLTDAGERMLLDNKHLLGETA